MATFNRVFVLYKRGSHTGGPEALHQLVHKLRGLAVEAFLVPLPGTQGLPRVDAYSKYDCPELPQVEDDAGNAVLAPETHWRELDNYTRARRIIWWLSVDNASTFRPERLMRRDDRTGPVAHARSAKRQCEIVLNTMRHLKSNWRRYDHLAQSHYAWNYIFDRLDVVPSMVSDYIPANEFSIERPANVGAKTLVFNPSKGFTHVSKLIAKAPDFEFRPMVGLTRQEVAALMAESSLYLDLGHHPGKDRGPREAALAGLIVVVGMQGAAANGVDVCLPLTHKVDLRSAREETILARLRKLLEHPREALAAQAGYIADICDQERQFEHELRCFFVEGKQGYDTAAFQTMGMS